MRVIRNLLILCLLMCGLLFGAQQFSAAMGKGDVWAYKGCSGACVRILDIRTMMAMNFNLQHVRGMFWMENGDLYMRTATDSMRVIVDSDLGLYRWNRKTLIEDGHSFAYLQLSHNRNNLLAIISDKSNYQIHFWDGVRWIEQLVSKYYVIFEEYLWSADGRFTFIVRENDGLGDLYVSDGLTLTNLGQLNFYGSGRPPTWSADSRLAFTSIRDGNKEIYVWDGIALTNISQHPANDYGPTWSADGQLAFTSTRDGNKEIYVWDGIALTNISQHPANDYNPTWSPDGQLAFTSERDGNPEIYVWDGKTFTKVSQTPEDSQLDFITGNNDVSILREAGWRSIHVERIDVSSFYQFEWVSHERLFYYYYGVGYLWKDGVTTKFFVDSYIIEYGDSGIAFISHRYRDDGQDELYVLDGQNIVGTGIVGEWMSFEPDGKGGLAGHVCNSQGRCDLYHWQDGHVRQITNTPHISEYGISVRP
jgi:WD40-like Beta Propeller Repeat